MLLSFPHLESQNPSESMASVLEAIKARLEALSIVPSSASASSSAKELKTYVFKPKGGDKQVVAVVCEHDKDVGKASNLAKTLGLKDMRAAEESYIQEHLGESKASGQFSGNEEKSKTQTEES